MKLKIKDPNTGLVRVVYDLTTGTYDLNGINWELNCINKQQKLPVKTICIELEESWQEEVQSI